MKIGFVSFGGSHIHGTSLAFQVGVVVTDGTHPPFRTAPLFRSCQVQIPVRLASSKS
jgi:hypothetical protein